MKYSFRPGLPATLLTLLLVTLFIRLGYWQLDRAEQKRTLQNIFDSRLNAASVALPQSVEEVNAWRYRRIRVTGQYDPGHQILLDNQVHEQEAGYHVITPLKPAQGTLHVLVDRGWIPAGDRSKLPTVATPQGLMVVEGYAWVPPHKFFELQPPPAIGGQWQPLWQNMDMGRYAEAVPFRTVPFVIRLDAGSNAGGFVRVWPRPAERIETNLSYAYQWFGFAFTLTLIYLVVNLKKKSRNE